MYRRQGEIPASAHTEDALQLILSGGAEILSDQQSKVHTLLQRIGSAMLARYHVAYAGPYGLSKKQRAAQIGTMQQAYLDTLTDGSNLLASEHSAFVERVAQHPESGEQILAEIMENPNYPEAAVGAKSSLTYLLAEAETAWPLPDQGA